ncbi:hypothetical protein RB608_23305 [Nocardioides sp. LHD-245]|uniref:hypothetical protein n=1 Tax=Nocardioides sp. LHD-245 TaxID=3051387 RepID=UPI0027E00963|nr:hypothetical protein [Nocardioides sp. LHD-245]
MDADEVEALYDERRAAFLDRSKIQLEHSSLLDDRSRALSAVLESERRLAEYYRRLDQADQRVERIQATLRALDGRPRYPTSDRT